MDKSAIKNFAVEARKMLIKMAITEAGLYGITKDGSSKAVQKGEDFEVYQTIAGTENRIFGDTIKKRANLVRAIAKHGFESVMEETAYTWFNRLIAIRFMEVNDYLPTRVRVLSAEANGKREPDVVTRSLDVELHMSAEELAAVQRAKEENRYDDAFRLLFIKQCNELNDILPGLFMKTDDYMELLLKLSYTNDGVIRMLVDSVSEENFDVSKEGQVEIIGWMYQYYNTELKDETFALLKKNVKITKERIPAATQLFTPDWIVRYMVENSLGRLWIEHLRANDDTVDEKVTAKEFGWKYYLPEAEQEEAVNIKLAEVRTSYRDMSPMDIRCIDPCMGSGHILVYMYDVLMGIYKSAGYSEREVAFYILESNISGLDIDQRAYQLSYFALMMKGRGYNRRFFVGREVEQDGKLWKKRPDPEVKVIQESNMLPTDIVGQIRDGFPGVFGEEELSCIQYVISTFKDAKEYGSILNVDDEGDGGDRQYAAVALKVCSLMDGTDAFCRDNDLDILQRLLLVEYLPVIGELMRQACVMGRKYDIVATNPPYMGSSGMDGKLSEYVKRYFADSKSDLFAVLIEKCGEMLKLNGFQAMITQHAFMFLSSYEKLRAKFLLKDIVNMAHLGARAFEEIGGEVVQTTSFVLGKSNIRGYKSMFARLVDFKSQQMKEQAFLSGKNRFIAKKENFAKIPSMPVAYWVSEAMLKTFDNEKVGDLYHVKSGLSTGDNDIFVRNWYEIISAQISIFKKQSNSGWIPYNKGGGIRKWYGMNSAVVNWGNHGDIIKNYGKGVFRNPAFYFQEGLTWSGISSDGGSFRFCHKGFIFDSNKGPMIFRKHESLTYLLGLLNSKITPILTTILNPTISLQIGDILSIPLIKNDSKNIDTIVTENISISKSDWDSYEISWDFKYHPLISQSNVFDLDIGEKGICLSGCYDDWKDETEAMFAKLKANETELNRIFIEIYGLQDEISPEVADKDITIRKADLVRDVKSLISYAVGCMFGRYSIDTQGLIHAGSNWNVETYSSFKPDTDNIIPITDEEYFDDDILCRFIEFVRTVYGDDTLEENLDFIANALSGKGNNSREIIRNYFIKDFFKEHCKIYQKRPIYWLFDSGKQNGFKALIYMHRYDKDTVGRVRTDYLHKTQNAIEGALKNAEYIISSSNSAVDRAKATKDRDRYLKQLSETRLYDQALAHIALQRIEIDLDDGVKYNYQLFQGVEVANEGTKKQTIDLLAKI